MLNFWLFPLFSILPSLRAASTARKAGPDPSKISQCGATTNNTNTNTTNNTITNTSTNMHALEFDSFMNIFDVLQSIQWDVNMRAWVKQDTLDVTFVRDKWIHLILQNELIDKWPGFFDPAGQVWRVSEPCPYFACEHFSSTPSARPPRPLLSLTPQFIRFERNIERALKLMYPVNGIRSQPAFS